MMGILRSDRVNARPRCGGIPPRGILFAAALLMAGCASDGPVAPIPVAAVQHPWMDDVHGLTPTAEQVALVEGLSDPARRDATVAILESLPPPERVDTLRAGLRMRDESVARECAARLQWTQIDRWECARCVDLLVDDVLRPGSAASFDEFRSYLGSVEVPRFLRAAAASPVRAEELSALGHVHRVLRSAHIPDLARFTSHPDEYVAADSFNNLELLLRWNDGYRETAQAAYLGETVPEEEREFPESTTVGIPRSLARALRNGFLDPDADPGDGTLHPWDRRWLWECTPSPEDVPLLRDLAGVGESGPWTVGGTACLLLGKLRDGESGEFLRSLADDADEARWALARRGAPGELASVRREAMDGDPFALALYMEADPGGARALLEEGILGGDDERARRLLDGLETFAVPGALHEPLLLMGSAVELTELLESGEDAVEGALMSRELPEFVPPRSEVAPDEAAALVLEGRIPDAVALLIEENPDEERPGIGTVDDPRVGAYLERLRRRRDLGLYWYATGQRAVAGDPEAREEFWGAMLDGRYRIMASAGILERTLGYDLPATMPFWIDELRSQCCRIVTNGAGDIVEKVFGMEDTYDSPYRTTYRRAKELWDSADGRFVYSRIAGYWVPEAR